MKKASSISHSIMNLTQAIANKRKLGVSCAYLLQEDLLDAESPPILKKLFSYNSDSPSISQVSSIESERFEIMFIGNEVYSN